ncbi:thioredoxin domain-containing protein [Nesterenkonia sp. MY13]|uniref:Thioredoxin domain-containing protein n=1 Tax=Nesterenkonia sedimenti TaxID=1463632 RepID=A0A7X8YCI3_9MICC|nr:thioredoxin domain-containing protein [Nesterenkonia sedimenti]NLS08470.1 thioredoxin domain-containing protein [Nesterenkonia sedimenti]
MTEKPQATPAEKKATAKPALNARSLWVPITVIVVAAAVVIWLLWDGESNGDSPAAEDAAVTQPEDEDQVDTQEDNSPAEDDAPEEAAEPEQPDLTELERHDPEDPLAIGEADAPVTMIVFSDYQCPYCASWSEDTLPSMMEYVEAGDMRIEWRDLNVFGPASTQAARAVYAAALQGEFWDYHHHLFANGEILSEDQLSPESMTDLAAEIGLDTEQFAQDMNSEEVEEQVDDNAELGYSIGAYSTPTFIIGGAPMVGAQPTEVFIQAVDDALERAEEG